jgi:hypothetical protein
VRTMEDSIDDPLCDDLYAVCDACHYRHDCGYLASGQVSLCVTVIKEVGENYPDTGRELDERLEQCFEKLMLKACKHAR